MSKKIILIISYIIIMMIILVFGLVSIYMYSNKQNVSIDMNMLEYNILIETGFNENRMKTITTSNITEIFDIPENLVKEVIGKVPILNISSSMYVIVYTDNVEEIKQKLTVYGNNYEKQWSTYMEDQYELVKQRKIGNIGNYVYMIVYETPSDILGYLS